MTEPKRSFFAKLLQFLRSLLFWLPPQPASNATAPVARTNPRQPTTTQRQNTAGKPEPKVGAAAVGKPQPTPKQTATAATAPDSSSPTAKRTQDSAPVAASSMQQAKPAAVKVETAAAPAMASSKPPAARADAAQTSAVKTEAVKAEETGGKGEAPVEENDGNATGVLFKELNLAPQLLKAIEDLGFKRSTPIQAETLPHTLAGRDLIGQAQTGTGKTAAFLITQIQRCLSQPIPMEERYAGEPRTLVIAPTRELVLQIEKDAQALAKHSKLNILAVVGGMSYETQRERLRNEVIDILIATPGRLIDFMGSRDVMLDQVEIMVIDEADRMLDMGFIPDVKRIVRATSKVGRQTLLFSATFSEDILVLAERWTNKPQMVEIEPAQVTAERVEQIIYMIAADDKPKLLVNILKQQPSERVIIFCNRRDETRKLHEYLSKKSISNAMISGELSQQQRLKTLERFREGKVAVLVATDVAGRGIHVDGVSHVINYNLPEDAEDYVHRIGRTGRAGSTGTSISFACEDDSFLIPQIEGYIGRKLSFVHPEAELLA